MLTSLKTQNAESRYIIINKMNLLNLVKKLITLNIFDIKS